MDIKNGTRIHYGGINYGHFFVAVNVVQFVSEIISIIILLVLGAKIRSININLARLVRARAFFPMCSDWGAYCVQLVLIYFSRPTQ